MSIFLIKFCKISSYVRNITKFIVILKDFFRDMLYNILTIN